MLLLLLGSCCLCCSLAAAAAAWLLLLLLGSWCCCLLATPAAASALLAAAAAAGYSYCCCGSCGCWGGCVLPCVGCVGVVLKGRCWHSPFPLAMACCDSRPGFCCLESPSVVSFPSFRHPPLGHKLSQQAGRDMQRAGKEPLLIFFSPVPICSRDLRPVKENTKDAPWLEFGLLRTSSTS